MTTIIGVDFSGARTDTNTWMTRGHLEDAPALLLESAQRIRRKDLHDLLLDIPTPAVVALDFPFGVPCEFSEWLASEPPPRDMVELWRVISPMALDAFISERDQFLRDRSGLSSRVREPKRAGDLKYHPESYSPLHNVNPNMLPMTFHGIQLLHRWCQEHPHRWHVPPLPATAHGDDAVTLLELMPGALLKTLGLPYKGYKRGRDSINRRTQILDGLSEKSGVQLPDLESLREDCMANDDCLDSVVAAVGAAMWAQDSSRFRHPQPGELSDAKLEGWIYVPER